MDIPEARINEVFKFYTMFNQKPVGKYHVQVCTNISCMLLGADEICKHISEKLEISEGELTKDGRFSITEVECLGACCNAPAMQINYKYHEDLTVEKVNKILDDLKNKS